MLPTHPPDCLQVDRLQHVEQVIPGIELRDVRELVEVAEGQPVLHRFSRRQEE